MNPIWSFAVAGASVFCLWLIGRTSRAGWVANIGCQFLWITYAVTTGQWGFMISASAFIAVSAWNLHRWWNGPPMTARTLPNMQLDATARVELQTIADNWREVHPAGETYVMDLMRVLDRLKGEGHLTGDEAVDLLMHISQYGTHAADELVLSTGP